MQHMQKELARMVKVTDTVDERFCQPYRLYRIYMYMTGSDIPPVLYLSTYFYSTKKPVS